MRVSQAELVVTDDILRYAMGEHKDWEVAYLNDFIVNNANTNIACAMKMSTNIGEIRVIAVGAAFKKFTSEAQKFIIEHERGHIFYGHLGKERNLEDELMADKYAYEHAGKIAAQKAFHEHLTLLFVHGSISKSEMDDIDEINARILNLFG